MNLIESKQLYTKATHNTATTADMALGDYAARRAIGMGPDDETTTITRRDLVQLLTTAAQMGRLSSTEAKV